MKAVNRSLAALAVILCWVVLAERSLAGGCRNISFVHHTPPVVIEKVVKVVNDYVAPAVAIIQPVPFAVPLYNTQYYGAVNQAAYGGVAPAPLAAPGVAAAAPCNEMASSLKKVAAVIDELHERLGRLETASGITPPVTKPPLKTPSPMQKVDPEQTGGAQGGQGLFVHLKNNCAQCHDESTKKLGKGFVLTTGGVLASLTDEQAASVIDRLSSDNPKLRMPPPDAPQIDLGTRLAIISRVVTGK